jgi:hypothetical protein
VFPDVPGLADALASRERQLVAAAASNARLDAREREAAAATTKPVGRG